MVTYDDYYPYGSIAQSGGTNYRYDYQGAYSEKDPVTGCNNFLLRMYDGKIGRWLSTDPKGQFASPYEGMGNNPVTGSDPTGGFMHEDKYGNVITDPTDDDTYAYMATYTSSKGVNFVYMGPTGGGWIANDQLPNSTLESLYWAYKNDGQDPFQGGYANEIRQWAASWAGFQSGYYQNAKALDMSAKVATTAVYLTSGGLSGMATSGGGSLTNMLLNNSNWYIKAGQGATSYLSQGLTVGFKNVDYLDVAFDSFGTPGSSAVFDAAIDGQIINGRPVIGIAIYNKDISHVVAQASSNYLFNRAADFKVMSGDGVTSFFTNLGGKILQQGTSWTR